MRAFTLRWEAESNSFVEQKCTIERDMTCIMPDILKFVDEASKRERWETLMAYDRSLIVVASRRSLEVCLPVQLLLLAPCPPATP